ncbi:MAG: MFS transporter [Marivita sp.]|uniref:MFS transporter n=1 Tax=Marivita sp. TaxID=2003365 RepID=UPI003EF9B5C4
MNTVFSGIWALLVGIVFIMLGNGMHFTLIGVRGGIEGFSATELAIVASGYFLGFMSGARKTPDLIRRVGHVRVFAALGSFMSAALIAFPLFTDPIAWTLLRVLVGFCMSGIYVTAESWLNASATNETRGKVLSAYMIAQTLGLIGAQGLMTLGDAATSVLFICASILVSISFGPILLSVTPTPATEVTRSMPLRTLFRAAPLGTAGMFLLGTVYATQAGMGAVYGTQVGMTPDQIALFIAMLFGGALLLQYPMGWLSDRMDRRKLILGCAILGASFCAAGALSAQAMWQLMAVAFLTGGVTTPLYALLLAYTNDALDPEEMPAASGGLVLIFGIGAILGPLVAGAAMERLGPSAFWMVLSATFTAVALYSAYRMTQRPPIAAADTDSYLGVLPTASAVVVEAAGAWAAEQAEIDRDTNT